MMAAVATKLWQILMDLWQILEEMSPYLLFGFLVAGLLSVLISQKFVERHLGGRGLLPVVKSALFGVPLPLCSCGVIPVGASLRRHGASKAATTAFLIATPQTGVDSILVTFSMLGAVFAIFRPLVAFISGIAGGALVDVLTHDAHVPASELPPCREACCLAPGRRSLRNKVRHVFEYGLITLPGDIGKALAIGLVVAALITSLVPDGFFMPVLGGGLLAMVVMMAVGIPVYVCATASIPVAAALIEKGVSPGAAFAFLVTGPATNAATIAMVWKVMGRKTAIIYLLTMAGSALLGGWTLDLILKAGTSQQSAHQMGWMLPQWLGTVSAVALLAILGVALFRRHAGGEHEGEGRHEHEAPHAARSVTLKIAGMTCSHCAASIQRALEECPGVRGAQVSLQGGQATVSGEGFDTRQLRAAVEQLGYKVASQPP